MSTITNLYGVKMYIFVCQYFLLGLKMGPLLPRVGMQGKLQLLLDPSLALGRCWTAIEATMALFSSLVWGQAARRSAGFRSEQGQDYYGIKDAKKLSDKPTNGAGPCGGGKRMYVMAPASFCGLSCSSSLDSTPTPNRQDKVK